MELFSTVFTCGIVFIDVSAVRYFMESNSKMASIIIIAHKTLSVSNSCYPPWIMARPDFFRLMVVWAGPILLHNAFLRIANDFELN